MDYTSSKDQDASFASKRPHFFKIILEDTIREGRLAIPRKFVSEYGSTLSKTLFLRVPRGEVWKIGVSKDDEEVWLQNGWRAFATFHSLDYGHLLVFEHQGCSRFSVLVFDKSAVEIKYPNYNAVEPKHGVEAEEPGTLSLVPHSRQKGLNLGTKRSSGQWFIGDGGTPVGRTRSLTLKEKAEALQRATAFQSENPYFMVAMQPAYIRSSLGIPKDFVKKYLGKKHCNVNLCVSDGRTWSAEYCFGQEQSSWIRNGWKGFVCDNNVKVGDVCVFELIETCVMKLGVSIFRVVEDSNLQSSLDGNRHKKVVHEIERTEDGILDDSTTRCRARGSFHLTCPHPTKKMRSNSTSQSQHTSTSVPHCYGKGFGEFKAGVVERTHRLTSKEKAEAFQRASAFQSRNPHFMVAMQPHYVLNNCVLNIPVDFTRKHLQKKGDDVILCVSDGRTWLANYHYHLNHSTQKAVITCGWKRFVLDNGLKVGDACVFELIKTCGIKLKVFISKAVGDPNLQQSLGSFKQLKLEKGEAQISRRRSFSTISQALEVAHKFTSEYPFFRVVMRSSYLSHGGFDIPRNFLRKYLNRKVQELMLNVADKSWPVKLYYHHRKRATLMTAGWPAFARENALQVGDVCVFELIERNLSQVTVSIFRNVD